MTCLPWLVFLTLRLAADARPASASCYWLVALSYFCPYHGLSPVCPGEARAVKLAFPYELPVPEPSKPRHDKQALALCFYNLPKGSEI